MRFASGLLIGGGLMYLLDPDKSGKRRRILARDKAVRAEHGFGRFADKTVRDMENRVQGMVAWVRTSIREREVPDEILEQRVRASIGRAVSHPHAIKVEAHDGIVRLYGPILQNEIESLLATVRSVRDARAVENCLEPHEIPDGVPDLQGKSGRRGRRIENWPFENGKTTVRQRRITKEEVEERIKSNEEPCDTGRSGILKVQER
jgi:hypothetical protein